MNAQINPILSLATPSSKVYIITGPFKTPVIILSVLVSLIASYGGYAMAEGPDDAITMAMDGRGEEALQIVIAEAQQVGFSGPAPDDELVYDPHMKRDRRGGTLDYDEPPVAICEQSGMEMGDCLALFYTQERQVRFGPGLFVTPTADGGAAARPAFDDVLSTYIEETGHSWQEYLYETEGRGSGRRTLYSGKTLSRRKTRAFSLAAVITKDTTTYPAII